MAKLEAKILVEVAGCVAQIQQAVKEHPSLQSIVDELMEQGERARSTGALVGARPKRGRRKMTAAQIKANSVRMKKRWREAKKAGKTSL